MSQIITGIIPVAPTVFDENEELDYDGQRRVVDYLVDGGADAVCILANYSEQFSLSDRERDLISEVTIEQAHGRIPVMVTTSHYSSRIAHERCRDAQDRGASLVMLMAPFFGTTVRVDERHVLEYFKKVADGLDIDIMIQDAPMSPTTLSVDLLARIAREVPQVRYVKIEVPRTAYKVRELVTAAGDFLPGIFDGEEAITLIPDLNAGVKGTMSSCTIPDQLGRIVRQFHSGSTGGAIAEWESALPLIHYENRHCGLNASKYLMKVGGLIGSDRTRAPSPPLPEFVERELLELARRQDALVLRWAR